MIEDSCKNNCFHYDRSNGRCSNYGPMTLSDSKVTAFLYFLLRDKVPAGDVECIMREIERSDSYEFTNGWLAQYAAYLDKRLHSKGKVEKDGKDKI